MAKKHWLVKQEPEAYSWSDFVEDEQAEWDGVRNYQARNNLRSMTKGDLVFYYHSVKGKEIVGVATVIREAYPDPSAKEGDWAAVDLKPAKPLTETVSLERIKEDPQLSDILLLKNSRLSVMPITPEHFERILELGATSL
jgi:predicted RNA-binding protein with PUA-like domain